MKKRKTYEVSVIDKTYSKTISDETKFYTSDTALELVFKLKETEYTFESAEIVLLNTNDKSLITRRVVKSDEGFVYTFEKDIIAHYGEWKAQLMFIENVDAHVASPIKFRIENDLYNTKPQALSDVVSWVNLKLYAEKLVGEFKQAVDEAFAKNVEIENTFKTNEQNRQTAFENAEQSRQTTFETAESKRDETFEINESTRQAQELEREKAEGARQTVFDGNEANRTETFNANEATRQENETVRQQAESQRQSTFETNETERQTTFETAEQSRQSSELIRVENEEQRKIDHANRSAELTGKADKVVLKNDIENGDFSDGLEGWNSQNSGNLLEDGYATNTGDGSLKYPQIWRNIALVGGGEYYIRFKYKTDASTIAASTSTFAKSVNETKPTNSSEDWHIFSNYLTPNSSDRTLRIYHIYSDLTTANGSNLSIDDVIFIPTTQVFGAGNEPTKEEMDELIKVTGYINEDYALNNKEMLIWTLALIRRNKNAIITLGGTI